MWSGMGVGGGVCWGVGVWVGGVGVRDCGCVVCCDDWCWLVMML